MIDNTGSVGSFQTAISYTVRFEIQVGFKEGVLKFAECCPGFPGTQGTAGNFRASSFIGVFH